MKRKQITAILMSAILTVSACMPMNSISAMAADKAGAGATEVAAEATAAQESAAAVQEAEAAPATEPPVEPQQPETPLAQRLMALQPTKPKSQTKLTRQQQPKMLAMMPLTTHPPRQLTQQQPMLLTMQQPQQPTQPLPPQPNSKLKKMRRLRKMPREFRMMISKRR